MKLRLKPYPEYKDSDLQWLENVPGDWKVKRAKNVFRPIDIRSETGNEELLTVSAAHGVIPRKTATVTMFKAESYIGYKLCWPGDLVINSLWAWMQGLGFTRYHGIISSAYGVYRLKPQYSENYRFFDYLLRSAAYLWELRVRSKGIWRSRYQLTDESFLCMPILLPPLEEQQKIVSFLDSKTRQFTRFIRAKRRMIELLKEQKQAIINKAVTKGIDPNVKLKHSGVDYLGDIPEHWEVTRIKNEFRCLNNIRVPLSSTERGNMKTRLYDYYGASGIIDKVDDYLFDDELLLIAEDGANLVLRNLKLAIIARGKFWVNNHAHILKPCRGDIQFLAYALEKIDYRPWISGAAQPKLTKDRLLSISFAVPTPEEQAEIVDFVKNETNDITAAIDRAGREIELVREYRARLISDVVTGKVDVRDILTEPVEEFEELDDLEEIPQDDELSELQEASDAED